MQRWVFIASVLAFCGACNTASTSSTFPQRRVEALRVCGMVSEDGAISEGPFAPGKNGEFETCITDCYEAANCTDLVEFICDTAGSVQDCRLNCFTSIYVCDSGQPFPAAGWCNGQNDCADGSDEANCPQYTCDDGSTIIYRWQCDMQTDCPDGSDEQNCAFHTCGDGAQFSDWRKCDLFPDCADESDEIGCADFIPPTC